ncbi:TetR/AcrR family transcriptional regulator [Maritalea sp.]|uniref:TetR/AcrR family transcriptional regulator n=1 Tax=Maritalea sp. TaxID=2003361 RepID=UPI003EF80FF6
MSSKRKSGNQTKDQILDAAWDLVSERGADASISQIANSVGVSRQAIYLHFGNRGGLLIALVRRADERFEIRQRLNECLQIADPIQRLDTAVSSWLDFVPKILPVANDLIRLKSTDADARTAWENRMDELKVWLKDLTTSLQKDGALASNWDVEDASEFMWTLIGVQVWVLLVGECGWSQEKTKHTLKSTVVSLLINPADSPHRD